MTVTITGSISGHSVSPSLRPHGHAPHQVWHPPAEDVESRGHARLPEQSIDCVR